MSDSLQDRGSALENRFFREKDQALLEKMRADMAAKDGREALTAVSGIKEPEVLDALIANNISPESIASVSLIPLVAVAWADGKMESAESEAILKAAADCGIEAGSASHELLAEWLKEKPGSELLDSWKGYVSAMVAAMEPAVATQMRSTVVGRASGVAEAAGGFLGLGNKISDAEQKVIDDLNSAFGG